MEEFQRGDIVEYVSGWEPAIGSLAVVHGLDPQVKRWRLEWIAYFSNDGIVFPKCTESGDRLKKISHVDDFDGKW